MSQPAKTVLAVVVVIIAVALAIWSGIYFLRPQQGREVGKLPGNIPLKEQEAGIAPAPSPPVPTPSEGR